MVEQENLYSWVKTTICGFDLGLCGNVCVVPDYTRSYLKHPNCLHIKFFFPREL